jgi:DNA polymerase IV (DinB-like DNA polymerase)
MQRIVFHLDMDAFFAAIEERDNPRFFGKPIVVGADPKGGYGRGVVSTANYEARKYGIKSAMPISWAYRACPTAIFLPPDMKRYKKVSDKIMGIIKKYSEVMEQVSLDEAYFELKYELGIMNYEKAEEIAKEIKKQIQVKERLTCSVGIGPNKLIAKIASDHKKPDGLTVVRPKEVQTFLDPKPADVLPGIGPKTYAVLAQKWNVKTVKDLCQISQSSLIKTFGIAGKHIFEMARGIDKSEIEEYHEVKSIGRQMTFGKDIRKSGPVIRAAFAMLDEVFKELRKSNLQGNTLTIIIRYAWFETHTSQQKKDHSLNLVEAKKLCLKLLLPYLGKKAVRLVGVRVSGF